MNSRPGQICKSRVCAPGGACEQIYDHNDMLNEMNRPKGPPAMAAVNSGGVQPGVEMVAGAAGSSAGGEAGVAGGVEGDLYLNDVADLL